MPKLHFVKSARKDNPVAKKGESYYWWAFMVGGRGGPKQFSKERPKASQLTQSEFLGAMAEIEEDAGNLVADDGLEDAVSELAGRIRDLGQEQSDRLENMPEGFQQGPIGETLQARAERCDEIANELDGIEFTDKSDEEDYWETKLEEVQGVDLSVN